MNQELEAIRLVIEVAQGMSDTERLEFLTRLANYVTNANRHPGRQRTRGRRRLLRQEPAT